MSDHSRFDSVNNSILDVLQDELAKGNLSDGSGQGMVLAYLCIIEVLDKDGDSRIIHLTNDSRMTTVLGLLEYAEKQVTASIIKSNFSQ